MSCCWHDGAMIHRMALLAALVCFALPAVAQDSAPAPAAAADRAQLAGCLRDNGASPNACIGAVAVPCVRAASSNPSGAEAACARREETAWRERLGLALQMASRPLDAGQRSRLAALQLTWESYVAQKCALYGAGQREALQPGRQAGCELREVAERAIEVAKSLPRTPARRPSGPPQIIR